MTWRFLPVLALCILAGCASGSVAVRKDRAEADVVLQQIHSDMAAMQIRFGQAPQVLYVSPRVQAQLESIGGAANVDKLVGCKVVVRPGMFGWTLSLTLNGG